MGLRVIAVVGVVVVLLVVTPIAAVGAWRRVTSSNESIGATADLNAPLPPLPAGWPATFGLGMSDSPGGASAMAGVAPFGFRYQYLAGGVNTGNGWSNWNGGNFVQMYVAESTRCRHHPGVLVLPALPVQARRIDG